MRRRLITSLGALCCCFGLLSCGAAQGGQKSHTTTGSSAKAGAAGRSKAGTHGLVSVTLKVGTRVRNYLLYVPPGDSTKHRLPLVLVYHGADNTASETVGQTGLLAVDQQRHDMILAFLQGYDDTWNDDAGDPPAEAANVNDIGFTTAVLSKLESSYYVNMSRVVAAGFSNGAILAQLLGCRIASNLTLIVPVEGQLATTFSSGCSPREPISVYEIHATADPTIPYAGGTFQGVGGPVSVLSAPASAKRWATLDGCPKHVVSPSAGGVTLATFKGCRDGTTVTLATIQGGSHEWPPNFGLTLAGVIASQRVTRNAKRP